MIITSTQGMTSRLRSTFDHPAITSTSPELQGPDMSEVAKSYLRTSLASAIQNASLL